MTLIPSETIYEFSDGDQGAGVFAIQKALNATTEKPANKVATDHYFERKTREAVERFQWKKNIGADGVFGARTSAAMVLALIPKVDVQTPNGLLRGLIEGESGNLIGAVNWSVAGGVDCSYTQRRVYEADYDDLAVVQRAWNPLYQMRLFSNRVVERFEVFRKGSAVNTDEYAWRLAVLNHNYPYAAQQYAAGKWPNTYANSPQQWVKNVGAKFPTGFPIETPHDWCRHYSLGAPEHDDPGTMTKYAW